MTPVLGSSTLNGIVIEKGQLEKRGGKTLVSAEIEYHFPNVAMNALETGIPLAFKLRFELSRHLPLGIRWRILREERNIQLRYLPLAKSYQVTDLGSGAVQSFGSLKSVLETLTHLRGWEIDIDKVETKGPVEASLVFRFDIEALPLPLRIQAYIAPEWHMTNGPYRWDLAL